MADFGKINLAALPSHKIVEFAQKGSSKKLKCIVLPIDKNHLFLSDKGNVFLDMVIFKMKEPNTDEETGAITQTHLVKQSLSKEVRNKMTEEEKMNQPIIGNLNIWEGSGKFIEKQASPDDSIVSPDEDTGEDLPF
jgi:hypothetical protein